MLTNQLYERHMTVRNEPGKHSDINRLLAAAVVSRQFCNLLLTDPAQAITLGYAGEHFSLSADEYNLVLSAHGSTLSEFAQQLCNYMPRPKTAVKTVMSENYQVRI
jgi:hypothetical protein